ncbi:MAG: arginine--tRNA ligase [Candidatus Omnitrophica bacterium]|nr:arginine--tRNA ligase [Candidatus Omnitrophota bacterium]
MNRNLRHTIIEAARRIIREDNLGAADIPLYLERPKEKKFGDWALNIAMKLAKDARKPPLPLAEHLAARLREALAAAGAAPAIASVEVKPPGFINIFLAPEAFADILSGVRSGQADYGRSTIGQGRRTLLEFVSANPTGPLSIAHARQAAVGDALANIMEFAGFRVDREYYINDDGNQIRNLGLTLQARYAQACGRTDAAVPADGYKGEYMQGLARELREQELAGAVRVPAGADALPFFMDYAAARILAIIREELRDFGVRFDHWISQKHEITAARIDEVFAALRGAGYVYEQDGAVWFRSTAWGDDKDRVLIKRDGSYTYITPDIAYHRFKFSRGYEKLIDILGPDHHGYINRLKAAVAALGYDQESLSVIIIQLATLFRGGAPVVMSTRAGEYVTLRELIEEVGKDVARFFFLMRRSDSLLEFDLELAKKQSQENPVYYVQYAYARIASIRQICVEQGIPNNPPPADYSLLRQEEELDLIRLLSFFPDVVENCALQLEPQSMSQYLRDLAKQFHVFYDKHRVLDLERNRELSLARLVLTNAVHQVLKTGLQLLGVEIPEKRM